MSASKQKGTAWETAIVKYLQPRWPHVERRTLGGTHDKGDVAGIPGVVIEAKNERSYNLASWMNEAEREGANANADVTVVWAHRKGRASPRDGYVIMSGYQFALLLKEAGY